jgi:hypothetical protein
MGRELTPANAGSRKTARSPDDDDEELSPSSRATKKRRMNSVGLDDGNSLTSHNTTDSLADKIREAARVCSHEIRNGNNSARSSGVAIEDGTPRAYTQPAEPDPDPVHVAEVLSTIVGNTKHLEENDSLNNQIRELAGPFGVISPKANTSLQAQSLPILDNLVRVSLVTSFPLRSIPAS